MWSLTFIPLWVYYCTLILGVGASLINSRNLLIIGILLIAGSCWQLGGINTETAWQTRVQEMEAKVVQAEARATEANSQVVTQVVTKTKLIKEKTQANVEYITQYVAQDLDSSCKLTSASVMLNNSASQGEVPNSTTGAAAGTSDVKASEFLATVTENYGTYYQLVEQVKGWQAWYYKQKKIFEE
jgi:hypothetical protein